MKVYASPIGEPKYDYSNFRSWDRTDQRYIEEVRAWLKENREPHPLQGEVIRFPIADGYAAYMVIDGRSMIHLPIGDAWQIPDAYARGLRVSDVRAMVERNKNPLFGRR